MPKEWEAEFKKRWDAGRRPTEDEKALAFQALRPKQREAFRLVVLEELTQEAAAERLGVARRSVGDRVALASERFYQGLCKLMDRRQAGLHTT